MPLTTEQRTAQREARRRTKTPLAPLAACITLACSAGSPPAGDAGPTGADGGLPPAVHVDCSAEAGAGNATAGDPANPVSWHGTNGDFTDACDGTGNLVKYACETVLDCTPGPNPGCNARPTGAVKPSTIDCDGRCTSGVCASRCPVQGDGAHVESVDTVGSVVVVDEVDGRRYACTVANDQANDSFSCTTDVHATSHGRILSTGFHGSYCTGGDLGDFGICFDGAASCNGQNCTYACRLAK
jgi:hypothetical protein